MPEASGEPVARRGPLVATGQGGTVIAKSEVIVHYRIEHEQTDCRVEPCRTGPAAAAIEDALG
jgi:hypothetical protein